MEQDEYGDTPDTHEIGNETREEARDNVTGVNNDERLETDIGEETREEALCRVVRCEQAEETSAHMERKI